MTSCDYKRMLLFWTLVCVIWVYLNGRLGLLVHGKGLSLPRVEFPSYVRMKKLLALCFVLGQFSLSSAAKELFVEYPHLLTSDSSTTFHIASQYEGFDSSIRSFCLQAASQDINAQLLTRPCCEHAGTECDPTSLQQWFMDPLGQLRLKS